MGSSQSTPPDVDKLPPILKSKDPIGDAIDPPIDDQKNAATNKRKVKRTGFAAVQHKCRRKKAAYDKCYAGLYGGFVSAKETDTSDCDELFDDWRECVLRGMKKDRERRGVTTPLNKESMLAELDDDDDAATTEKK